MNLLTFSLLFTDVSSTSAIDFFLDFCTNVNTCFQFTLQSFLFQIHCVLLSIDIGYLISCLISMPFLLNMCLLREFLCYSLFYFKALRFRYDGPCFPSHLILSLLPVDRMVKGCLAFCFVVYVTIFFAVTTYS